MNQQVPQERVNRSITSAMDDMTKAKPIYRPTPFWHEATSAIADDITESGIDTFRSLPRTLKYFVPTFGHPGNGFTVHSLNIIRTTLKESTELSPKAKAEIEASMSGSRHALADYRVLMATEDGRQQPDLTLFSESAFGSPIEQFTFDDKNYSRSSLNYLLGLAFLKKHMDKNERLETVMEIGGGFGTLGEILFKCGSKDIRYIDIDIPPMCCIAEEYLRQSTNSDKVLGYLESRDKDSLPTDSLPQMSALASWQIEKIEGQIDLFTNFISFQEMEPDIVKNYAQQISRLNPKYILLRNMKEGKQLRSKTNPVGVETPILGEDYPKLFPNHRLIATDTDTFGYRTWDGFHSELLLLKNDSI